MPIILIICFTAIVTYAVRRRNESHSIRCSRGDHFSGGAKPTGLMWKDVGICVMLLMGTLAFSIEVWGQEQNVELEQMVSQPTGHKNSHGYVDLGLSVKWATCNIGADSPSDYGNYYAWGETEPKSQYREINSVTYGRKMKNIAGKPKYDAARANWGGTWRLPTEKEIDELVGKCVCVWTTQGGHHGYLITGPNGNSIFLPAAGWWSWDESDGEEEVGGCWGDAPTRDVPDGACSLSFDSGDIGRYVEDRFIGQTVRPVTK